MKKNVVNIGPIHRRKHYEKICDILSQHLIMRDHLIKKKVPRYIFVGNVLFIPSYDYCGYELLSPYDVMDGKYIFKRKLPRNLE